MWTEGVPEITKDAEGEWEEPKMKKEEEEEKEVWRSEVGQELEKS